MKRSVLLISLILYLTTSCNIACNATIHYQGRQNDTVKFHQIVIDTIDLIRYEPTESGKCVLNKVLQKHQDLIKYPQGTFTISEEKGIDSILKILYYDTKIDFFAQYGWDSFIGIVYYKGSTFLLADLIDDESMDILFNPTNQIEQFCEYSDKLFVKRDEKIYWRFLKLNGKFHYMSVSPLNEIIEFE